MGCGCRSTSYKTEVTVNKKTRKPYTIIDVIKDLLTGKTEKVSKQKEHQRLDICLNCDELFKLTKSCKKCGCFVKAKVKYKKSQCPIGYWE